MTCYIRIFFFFNDTATTEIYTLPLHDTLPIYRGKPHKHHGAEHRPDPGGPATLHQEQTDQDQDRKSTRLNSSHDQISYAVFCLKKKKKKQSRHTANHTQASEPTAFLYVLYHRSHHTCH